MSNVVLFPHSYNNSSKVVVDKDDVDQFDFVVADAIKLAKNRGVPQGLIVAILQAQLLIQTQELIE